LVDGFALPVVPLGDAFPVLPLELAFPVLPLTDRETEAFAVFTEFEL
jgi:hypothetical protein